MQFSWCSDISQSFAPIGLHKTDAACDWLLIKQHYLGKKGLPGVQVQKKSDYISYRRHFSIYRKEDVLFRPKIRGAYEKFKNQPRPLLRPRSVSFSQHFRNLSRKTVPLMCKMCIFLTTKRQKAAYFLLTFIIFLLLSFFHTQFYLHDDKISDFSVLYEHIFCCIFSWKY